MSGGLPPILPDQPVLLILGSLPSQASLREQQYYAHRRNAFWPIIFALTGIRASSDYSCRVLALRSAGIALWDVLAAAEREGSADANIVVASERPNEIATLLRQYQSIKAIALNGGKAYQSFRRHILPALKGELPAEILSLPSTSPANAGMSFEQKLSRWRQALRPYLPGLVGLEGFEPPTEPL